MNACDRRRDVIATAHAYTDQDEDGGQGTKGECAGGRRAYRGSSERDWNSQRAQNRDDDQCEERNDQKRDENRAQNGWQLAAECNEALLDALDEPLNLRLRSSSSPRRHLDP